MCSHVRAAAGFACGVAGSETVRTDSESFRFFCVDRFPENTQAYSDIAFAYEISCDRDKT